VAERLHVTAPVKVLHSLQPVHDKKEPGVSITSTLKYFFPVFYKEILGCDPTLFPVSSPTRLHFSLSLSPGAEEEWVGV